MSISTDYNYYSNSFFTQQMAKKQKPSLNSFIDSDKDKVLSAEELLNFADEINTKTENTLDLSSIITQYDANEDGELDESEQEAMNKDRALEKLMASGHTGRIRMMREAPPPLSKVSEEEDEAEKKIREKIDEILEIMEERLAKRLEEKALTEDTVSKSEAIKLAFMNRFAQSIDNYEKSFWFESAVTEGTQYGA